MEYDTTEMVRGVEFAVVEDNGDTRYHLLFPDGTIDDTELAKVYADGDFTMAITQGGVKVMVDDYGVHYDW